MDAYFDSLLYGGGDPDFPADRWSYFESTEEAQRFYGEGRTLANFKFALEAEPPRDPSCDRTQV